MIEKRLKQGLSFPDPEYTIVDNEYTIQATNSNSNLSNNGNHLINQTYANNNAIYVNTNGTNGIIKQNSQLLPKRHGVQLAARSSSQKNIDFKSIYNNMNVNNPNISRYNNQSRESEMKNINPNSNSPSPDFIAAAMNPAKNANGVGNANTNGANNIKLASASSIRSSRQGQYPDVSQRNKANSNTSNYSSTYANNNSNKYTTEIQARIQNSNKPNHVRESESRTADRYNLPANRMSPTSEDSYQPIVYYTTQENSNGRTSAGLVGNNILHNNISNGNTAGVNNNNNNTTVLNNMTNNSAARNGASSAAMRSLPSSLYRGSPERSLPRSPERQSDINTTNYRPTSRISNSRPSVSELQTEKMYDQQKYKSINYLTTKRSLTSCDDPTQKNTSSIVTKNRQLHMGKAKIDLETQPSNNLKKINLKK